LGGKGVFEGKREKIDGKPPGRPAKKSKETTTQKYPKQKKPKVF